LLLRRWSFGWRWNWLLLHGCSPLDA
jgi:hypothetical protein